MVAMRNRNKTRTTTGTNQVSNNYTSATAHLQHAQIRERYSLSRKSTHCASAAVPCGSSTVFPRGFADWAGAFSLSTSKPLQCIQQLSCGEVIPNKLARLAQCSCILHVQPSLPAKSEHFIPCANHVIKQSRVFSSPGNR